MITPILKARQLCFAYGDRLALREVSIDLFPREIVALIGPNGSGKSTLLRQLLGQLRGAGTIDWLGKSMNNWRTRALAQRVAYLAQTPAWDELQTVADVLRLGRAPYWGAFGLESASDLDVVREVAQTLQLAEMLKRPLSELSGGQRQRVFIGRCLVQQPAALLLDEPNTYLDLRHGVEMNRLLRTLAAEKSIGVLLSSHDLNLAASTADRLILLSDGTVAAAGSPDEVMQPELLSRVYGVKMHRMAGPDGRPIVFPA